jgi:hypothetical protein
VMFVKWVDIERSFLVEVLCCLRNKVCLKWTLSTEIWPWGVLLLVAVLWWSDAVLMCWAYRQHEESKFDKNPKKCELKTEPRANVHTDIPTRLMSRKDERICNGAFFYLEWRTSRNTCNRLDRKSSECAARNCNRAIGLFSHFADPVCSKPFEWCMRAFKSQSKRRSAAIVRHHALTASLHNSKKNPSLHVNCTPRALYV